MHAQCGSIISQEASQIPQKLHFPTSVQLAQWLNSELYYFVILYIPESLGHHTKRDDKMLSQDYKNINHKEMTGGSVNLRLGGWLLLLLRELITSWRGWATVDYNGNGNLPNFNFGGATRKPFNFMIMKMIKMQLKNFLSDWIVFDTPSHNIFAILQRYTYKIGRGCSISTCVTHSV